MTTAVSSPSRKSEPENKKLSLFSPITLLGLLAIVFTFFLTSSGEASHSKDSLRGARTHKAVMTNELDKSDSEILYRSIVTNGDAIRSVLQ